jgi:uncharacterized protein YkwD
MNQTMLVSLGLVLAFCSAASAQDIARDIAQDIAQDTPVPAAQVKPVTKPAAPATPAAQGAPGVQGTPAAQAKIAAPAGPTPPADLISNFRHGHGEGRVTLDPMLNRIAQAQADAMAARDVLDHDVLGPFSSRVASAGAERAAENIAYGYDTFAKTLGQWINSPEHRKNLLLGDASRVGVAHTQSSKTHRIYWAMEIAGGYERKPAPGTSKDKTKGKSRVAQEPHLRQQPRPASSCHIKLLGVCL